MWKIVKKVLGYKYLVNVATGEMHVVNKITMACGVHNMVEKNKLYITKDQLSKIEKISLKLNGCTHCFKSKDTD
jgi:hypothetical protein